MAAAVALIEGGQVRADLVAGEVFELDRIGEAMGLLGRSDPARDSEVRIRPDAGPSRMPHHVQVKCGRPSP